MQAMKLGNKQLRKTLKSHEALLKASSRTLWAIVYQLGGEFIIHSESFTKAHEVDGRFDFVENGDGSYTIKCKIDKDFSPINDGEGQ